MLGEQFTARGSFGIDAAWRDVRTLETSERESSLESANELGTRTSVEQTACLVSDPPARKTLTLEDAPGTSGDSLCARSVGLLGALARASALSARTANREVLVRDRVGTLVAEPHAGFGSCFLRSTGEGRLTLRSTAGSSDWRFAPIRRWTIGEHGPRPAQHGPSSGQPRFLPRLDRLLVDPPSTLGGRRVDGRRLFRGLVQRLGQVLRECTAKAGLECFEIQHFLINHANAPLLVALAEELELCPEQVAWNRSLVDDSMLASLTQAFSYIDANRRPGPCLVAEFECGYSITAAIAQPPIEQ